MSQPVFTVFGRRGQPDTLALVVARSIPGAAVSRSRRAYRVTLPPDRPLFRKAEPELVVEFDPARFAGPGADHSREELREHLVRTIRGPGFDTVLGMIPDLRLAVAFRVAESARAAAVRSLHPVAIDVAGRTDGFVLDRANGRILSSTGLELGSTEQLLADSTPLDPSTTRVGQRLVALVAASTRAFTEFDGRDLDAAFFGINKWVRNLEVSAELEPDEAEVLDQLPGRSPHDQLARHTWHIEGGAVLAWALTLLEELPPFDHPTDPALLTAAVGFPRPEETRAVLGRARRRPQAVVDAEAARYYSLSWRLREFLDNGQALDLEGFAREPQPGPLRFDRVPLIGGDLNVQGVPITEADPDAVDQAHTVCTERLLALNWLRRGGRYSATTLDP